MAALLRHRRARRAPALVIAAVVLAAGAPAADATRGARPGRRATEAVPVLMYHVIAPPIANAPFPELYVDPSGFAAQMHALARAGYRAVTLDRVWAAWHHGPALPRRPVVVSFDNGYRTQYTRALPILGRLGWVGVENLQLTGLPPSQGGLSAAEVRRLIAAGWELDTQGWSHADLVTLDAVELHHEVAVARAVLRRRYHVAVNWFCYPSGHYDPTVVAAVAAAGFRGATTVVPGWARPGDDPYRLPRLRVVRDTTPAELLAQIAASRSDAPAPLSYGS